ncbi:peptide ABC transporter substrate-binding protein [Salimicrobium jeotgali]|uniref:Peptide ABC transporter substrate-binding protein n=1 Tax=Salimicrobium jeotgali TaxID=1230341 RepID=K2FKE8_9BACI|nr:peptide ABC transporter substrate-binding protein [Salimicrobium jeotgali]AKG03350.1 peptide ABC transporter substrate-binding protein [Salimicrobium jeotgali]EKE31511.1 peptide/nickel ABC transporter extracellular binding protein [Salimicrobium jeotgali]MBM7696699.1 oligopeptide transport system substrate-binding protein [Salimicrobium jeotgali]
MSRKLFLGLILSITLLFVLAACGGNGGNESSSEGSEGESSEGSDSGSDQSISFTAKSELPSMDPSLITDSVAFQWAGETYEGLYRLDENGELAEGIAKDHEVSEDGTTWTFNLREDAQWENGDPVTAHDFVYAWQRAVNPETGSEYGPYFLGGVVKNASAIADGEMKPEELGVKAVDDYTFEVNLEQPVPYFDSMTVFITFMPLNKSYVEEQGDSFSTEADNTLANGPFKMTEWKHGEGWKVVKNENYWDADTVELQEIDVKVIKETSTAVNLFQSGELDQAELNAEFVDEYRSSEHFNVVENPYLYFFKFNQEHEVLGNADARKAMSMAIDRKSLTDVILNDGSVPANGYVPSNFVTVPGSDGKDFREVQGPLVGHDVEKAKEHWDKALEALGKDSVTLELMGDDTDSSQNAMAYYKEQLETNLEGLSVKVVEVPFKERVRRDQESEFEIEAATWGPDYADANTYLNMYLTDGQNNNMNYSSEEYDSLINKANTELAQKPEKRYETFMEAERLLIEEDAAVAPLYQDAKSQLLRSNIEGVFPTATGPNFEFKWASVK